MKKAVTLAFLLLWLSQIGAQMPVRPSKYTPINDFARVLAKSQKQELSDLLFQHEKKTDEQFVFVTVANMGGETVENFAQQLYNGWGIGKKGNGALVLIAMAERKARIQVGTGLENRLTAAIREEILQNQLVPNLKKGEFYQAFLQTAIVLTQNLDKPIISDKGENWAKDTVSQNVYTAARHADAESNQQDFLVWVWAVAFIFVVLIVIVSMIFFARNRQAATGNFIKNKSISKQSNTRSLLYETPIYIEGDFDNSINRLNSLKTDSSPSTDSSSSNDSNPNTDSSSSNDSSSNSDWGGGTSDSGSSSDY